MLQTLKCHCAALWSKVQNPEGQGCCFCGCSQCNLKQIMYYMCRHLWMHPLTNAMKMGFFLLMYFVLLYWWFLVWPWPCQIPPSNVSADLHVHRSSSVLVRNWERSTTDCVTWLDTDSDAGVFHVVNLQPFHAWDWLSPARHTAAMSAEHSMPETLDHRCQT